MIKKLFFSTILFLSAAILFAADWAAIVQEQGQAVAKITVTEEKGAVISQGTGFVVETVPGVQRMITNAHVVAEAEHSETVSITAEFLYPGKSQEEYSLTIDRIDRAQDLCLLILSSDAPAVLKISDNKAPALMEEILIVGYPLGRSFKTTPGYIQAFQDVEGMGRMLDLSALVAPGNSGGPVIDGSSEVIGIITAVIPGYNFNLAIPAENLLSVILNETRQFNLLIDSQPREAWVFIDGDYKGKTPLKQSLYNREYKLRVEKEGFRVVEEQLGPWADTPGNIDVSLQTEEDNNPFIKITVSPSDADVSINNREMGKSPLSVQFPSGSILRIRMTAPGYREKLEFYEVTEDENQKIEIELEKTFLLW